MRKLIKTSHPLIKHNQQYLLSCNLLSSKRACFSVGTNSTLQSTDPIEVGLGREVLEKLPPYFVDFHRGTVTSEENGLATGSLKVTRGKTLLSQLFATIGGLPKENEIGAQVFVRIEDNHWKRTFDNEPLVSKWSIKDDLVVESFGIFSFGFKLVPIYRNDVKQLENLGSYENVPYEIVGFEHQFKKMYLFGFIPLPNMFSIDPSGKSICVFDKSLYPPNSWYVEVNIKNPIIGHLCSYIGIMSINPLNPQL